MGSGVIAALYVETNGIYFGDPEIDPWDEKRDARRYTGPHAVIAHPPCQRWCTRDARAFSRSPDRYGDVRAIARKTLIDGTPIGGHAIQALPAPKVPAGNVSR